MKPPKLIETERLILRLPKVADANEIFKTYAHDPEVSRYLIWHPHEHPQETEAFLDGCVRSWDGDTRFPYVITLKSDLEPIGMIEIRLDGFRTDVGYVLGRAYWGKGYMSEALRAIVNWALSQTDIYRVSGTCDVKNLASARVMEKAGMQFEGVLRRCIIFPNISDEPRDIKLYAVVK